MPKELRFIHCKAIAKHMASGFRLRIMTMLHHEVGTLVTTHKGLVPGTHGRVSHKRKCQCLLSTLRITPV
jgi:hypothetical protein